LKPYTHSYIRVNLYVYASRLVQWGIMPDTYVWHVSHAGVSRHLNRSESDGLLIRTQLRALSCIRIRTSIYTCTCMLYICAVCIQGTCILKCSHVVVEAPNVSESDWACYRTGPRAEAIDVFVHPFIRVCIRSPSAPCAYKAHTHGMLSR
jgi:hypothetical protein